MRISFLIFFVLIGVLAAAPVGVVPAEVNSPAVPSAVASGGGSTRLFDIRPLNVIPFHGRDMFGFDPEMVSKGQIAINNADAERVYKERQAREAKISEAGKKLPVTGVRVQGGYPAQIMVGRFWYGVGQRFISKVEGGDGEWEILKINPGARGFAVDLRHCESGVKLTRTIHSPEGLGSPDERAVPQPGKEPN